MNTTTLHLNREDLVEFMYVTYEGLNLDGSDVVPMTPFEEWTIAELFTECMEWDYLSGSVTEDGPEEVYVDGIHVLGDCYIIV